MTPNTNTTLWLPGFEPPGSVVINRLDSDVVADPATAPMIEAATDLYQPVTEEQSQNYVLTAEH